MEPTQQEPRQEENRSNQLPVVQAEVLPPVAAPAPAPVGVPPFAEGRPLPLGLNRRQIVAAFAIAGVSDMISAFTAFAPPVQWAVDLVTAAALFGVLGWRWLLLPALVMEAVPGLGVVPFWVLVVSAIAVWGEVRPKLN
jgi:hypothetical protein